MEMNSEWLSALWGGVLIGISVSLMLLWNGRVTGISGIIYGLLKPLRGDIAWRVYFILGLVIGGLTLQVLKPTIFSTTPLISDWNVVIAGLMVGFGTVLGSGCTSGHGVCGISRLSPRSLVATALFIFTGVATVFLLRNLGTLT